MKKYYILIVLSFVYSQRSDHMALGYTQIAYGNSACYGLGASYSGVLDTNSDYVLDQRLGVMLSNNDHDILYLSIMISFLHRNLLINGNMFYDWGITGNFLLDKELHKAIPTFSPEIGGGFLFPNNFFRISRARFAFGYNILENIEAQHYPDKLSFRMDVYFGRTVMNKE